MVIRILNELRGRVKELSENFNIKEIGHIKIEIEHIKKNQSERKNSLKKINSRVD